MNNCIDYSNNDGNVDLIIRKTEKDSGFDEFCSIDISDDFKIVYYPVNNERLPGFDRYGYFSIPGVYSLLGYEALYDMGVPQVRNKAGLNLTGENIIIGIVDDGIDYSNAGFMDRYGNTRIKYIWDQAAITEQTQNNSNISSREEMSNNNNSIIPVPYGREFVNAQIQTAIDENDRNLLSDDVRMMRHGTEVALCAASSDNNSPGVATQSELIIVKLRNAGEYLRNIYLANDNAKLYSESDIMIGVKYIRQRTKQLKRKLVLLVPLGTSLGSHTGSNPLSVYLDRLSGNAGVCVVVPTGNEGGQRGHVSGLIGNGKIQEVEMVVDDFSRGFICELWSYRGDSYSVEIIAPSGEVSELIRVTTRNRRFLEFVLDKTMIDVYTELIEPLGQSQVIAFRFINPTYGIWRFRIYGERVITRNFNMWLAQKEMLSGNVYFLESSSETTLTEPSSAVGVISVGAYDYKSNSVYLSSGRGYSASLVIKPEIVAPGVNTDETEYKTSYASAYVAGIAALFYEWQEKNDEGISFDTEDIKSLLIMGARRDMFRNYPNNQWGYGVVNIENVFDIIANI